MTSKSSGFTLIELLVVVAILGIIAAIGIMSYNGYVGSAKKRSAENVMQQISLGQTEFYSDNGFYYRDSTGSSCNPTSTTSSAIETNLLGGTDSITSEMGYELCIANDATNYKVVAKENGGNCEITMTALGTFVRTNC
jgi:prepilin-type N-terminal cleavage/methylation domain-containing protein